jgi:hypothetical protein
MGLHNFPFMAVTVTALFVHVVSAVASTLLQPIWKGDTILDRWWDSAGLVRLFSVNRTDVRMPVTWGFIVVARVAFAVAALSLLADLLIY